MRGVLSGVSEIQAKTGIEITQGTRSFAEVGIKYAVADGSTNLELTKNELLTLIGRRVKNLSMFVELLVNKYYN